MFFFFTFLVNFVFKQYGHPVDETTVACESYQCTYVNTEREQVKCCVHSAVQCSTCTEDFNG